MQEYKYYIGGEFKKSQEGIERINPATEEAFAMIFETTPQDLQTALGEARRAQKTWGAVSFKERARLLREVGRVILDNLRPLAELESREIGKSLKESLFVDVPLAAEAFNYYAAFLESLQEEVIIHERGTDLIQYAPFGVAGVYLPYNVPLMIFGFSCAACLAAGNSLIIKASEYGSLSLLELARYIDSLDMPKGLVNIITGKGQTIGKALSESDIDLISFTGSRETLKKIIGQQADNPKKILCELGGCNVAAVFSDAEKEDALQNILASSFMKQGQMCIGTSLVLVQEGIYKDFVKDLVERAGRIRLGNPFEPDTGMGPLPTQGHREGIHRRVKELEKKGAKVLCGGKPLETKGYFYPPTILETGDIVFEEFFAPVIMVKGFKDGQELEEIIERNPAGLILQLWTKDCNLAHRLARSSPCGTVWINTFAQMGPQTPFGGIRQSGWGRNLGRFGFFEYVQPKHIGIGLHKSSVDGWFGI